MVTFKKAGYQSANAKLDVPGPGKETRLIQPLAVSDDLARIKLDSEPPGAQVIENGQLLAGVTTPAEVLVEAKRLGRLQIDHQFELGRLFGRQVRRLRTLEDLVNEACGATI